MIRLLLFSCVLGLLMLVGPATIVSQEPDEWQATETEFLRDYRFAGNNAMSGNALEEKRNVVRRASQWDHANGTKLLLQLLGSRSTPLTIQEDITDILAGFSSPEARELIREVATNTNELTRHTLRAFIQQGDPESRIFLLQLVKDAPSPRLRALAIEGVTLLPGAEASSGYTEALIAWLQDPGAFQGTRFAAARALAEIPSASSIPALIELLVDPLMAKVARDALLRLTGETHWMDRDEWQNWWDANQAGYQPRPLAEADFVKLRDELIAQWGDGMGLAAQFYGREVEGKNILFILDSSGSMMTADRMDSLRTEMESFIGSLNEVYSFGIITFPETNIPGRDFDEASERHRERSLEFVSGMYPNGDTPMVEALEHAFKRVVPRNKVDTIYLLSDGYPSDLGVEPLPDVVLELNEELGVRVNTIFIGTLPEGVERPEDAPPDPGKIAMQQVAEVCDGTFWSIE